MGKEPEKPSKKMIVEDIHLAEASSVTADTRPDGLINWFRRLFTTRSLVPTPVKKKDLPLFKADSLETEETDAGVSSSALDSEPQSLAAHMRALVAEEVLRLQTEKLSIQQNRQNNETQEITLALAETAGEAAALRLQLAKVELDDINIRLNQVKEDKTLTLRQRSEEMDAIRSRVVLSEADLTQAETLVEWRQKEVIPDNTASLPEMISLLQEKLNQQEAALISTNRENKRRWIWQTVVFLILLIVIAIGGILSRLYPPDTPDSNARALVEMAGIYQAAEQKDDAERVLDEAVKTGISDETLLNRAGQLYLAIGAYKKAAHVLEEAVEKKPGIELYRLNLARSYQQQDQLQTAIDQYLILIKLNPDNFTYHMELGICYEKQQQYDLAESEYRQVIDIIPERYEGYYNLAQLYRVKKADYTRAAQQYLLALEKKPDFYLAEVYYAASLAGLEQYDDAIVYLQKAIELYPEGQTAPLFLGDIYYSMQQFDKASLWYQQALDLNPNLVSALVGAGRASASINNCSTARQYFQKALQIQPANRDAQNGLDQCESD